MAAIASLSDLVNYTTGGSSGAPETISFYKAARVGGAAAAATVANKWTSIWQYDGTPSHGAAPGAVAAPTNATAGGLKQTDPAGGKTRWLTGALGCASSLGTLVLFDRLLHISGLSGTTLTAQTVGGSLGRYTSATDAPGNQIWAEIYTQIGTSATTITASYTDQDGNSGATSQAVAFGGTGNREAQRLIQLPLASGDTGVTAVASCTIAGSTGTAGDFGINIMRPLLSFPITTAAVGTMLGPTGIGLPVSIKTDACLFFAFFANGTTAPEIMGQISLVDA